MILKRNNEDKLISNKNQNTCVVTCHFNFAKFKSPERNLRRFVLQMKASSIPIFGIELYLDNPITKGWTNWIQIKASNNNICFQKEALLNILISKLPSHIEKVICLDHDVYFSSNAWFSKTIDALDKYDIVQPYSLAVWNGPDGKELFRKESFFKSKGFGHPGFGIAFKRNIFNRFKFFDKCPLGGGDIIFAAAVSNRIKAIKDRVRKFFNTFNANEWIEKVGKLNCGYINEIIYHEFHGNIKDRKYTDRSGLIKELGKVEIIDGLLTVENYNLSLEYFKSRNEDSAHYDIANNIESIYNSSTNACVVTCHSKYIHFIEKVIKTINRQTRPFDKKVLVLDSFDYKSSLLKDWTVLRVNYKNPNLSRNAGLNLVNQDWCIFWDGDNFMPSSYLEEITKFDYTNKNIGFVYPNIKYINATGKTLKLLNVPEYDYWLNRDRTFIDTSSLWNVKALKRVGGFNKLQPKFDDYELSLRVSRNGYTGIRSHAYSQITQHSSRRSKNKDANLDAIWNAYNFAIVTAFYNHNCKDVLEWYKNAELPPNNNIYWFCDFTDKELRDKLELQKFNDNIKIIDSGSKWNSHELGHRHFTRHNHVANMYNNIFAMLNEDMIMMIEDDNIGPLNGIKTLLRHFTPQKWDHDVAMVGGKYRSRSNVKCACASSTDIKWTSIGYENIGSSVIPVKMMGGGFTLYSNAAIKKSFPIICTNDERGLIGWDGHLGMSFSRNKYNCYLDGSVEVKHKCKEVIEAYNKGIIKNI